MPVDRRMRRKMEELRRAGLEYVAADRMSSMTAAFEAAVVNSAVLEAATNSELPPEMPAATSAMLPPTSEAPMIEAATRKRTPRSDIPKLSPEQKQGALQVLAEEVAGCTQCTVLARTRTQTVFADGSPSAELCFIGEAPGADEDAQGVPFVGRAGQLLTKIIEACGLKREEVYICNVIKCRPPENRNPLPDEICNCRPYLESQLQIIQPKMLVALGKFAAAHLLLRKPEEVPITKMRGQIHEYCGIPFMITLHPAYLLRNPPAKKDVWEDMKVVMRELGRPIE